MSNVVTFPTTETETLAELLSKVLNHPDLPVEIYNAISEACTEIDNAYMGRVSWDLPCELDATLQRAAECSRLRELDEETYDRVEAIREVVKAVEESEDEN